MGEIEAVESRIDVGVNKHVKTNVIEVECGHCSNFVMTLSACELDVLRVTTWMAAEKTSSPTATIQFTVSSSALKTKY